MSLLNRLLSKFASADEVPGASGAQNRSVHEVLENTGSWEASGQTTGGSPKGETSGSERVNSSTGATKQFAAEVEFRKKSQDREAITTALSAAFGTAGTVMILGALRIPNCYMALSFAATLSLLPTPSFSHFLFRISTVALGVISGVLLLTALPESPWIYFSLMGFIAALGYNFFLKHLGAGNAYAFTAYFLAMCVMTIVSHFSGNLIVDALKLWWQSTVPIIVTYIVALLLKKKPIAVTYPTLPLSSIISIGMAVSIAFLVDVSIRTDEAARLVMACVSGITALEIERSTDLFMQRMLGYFLGGMLSIAFIVMVVALGNDFGVYLLALALLFGFFEWLAAYYSQPATLFRAIATMLSFSVLMLPAPDSNLHIALQRVMTSFIGFFIAIVVFLMVREAAKFTKFFMPQKNQ